jgi:hypothetical protein
MNVQGSDDMFVNHDQPELGKKIKKCAEVNEKNRNRNADHPSGWDAYSLILLFSDLFIVVIADCRFDSIFGKH